jgi:signal transduction histidine kinase
MERIHEDLQAIRGLVRDGSHAAAGKRVEALLDDPDLMGARMSDGRSIAPMVAYLATELASTPEERTNTRTRLRSMILDPGLQAAMPVSQLLYFLGRVRNWGEDPQVEAAYRFARNSVAWIESRTPDLVERPDRPIMRVGQLIGFRVSRDSGTVILEVMTLAERIQYRLDLLEERAGGRLILREAAVSEVSESSDDAMNDSPVLVEAGFPLDEWVIEFVGEDRDTVLGRADREALWLAIVGALVIAISISLSLALFKVMQRQARLAQLKNDLVATVSHELKTPVASIRLLVDTLQSDRSMDPVRVRDYLGLISRENNRLGHLIENFLSFSRMERNKNSFELRPVGPAGIAREAEKTFHERRPEWEGTLVLDIEDGLPPIQADHDALQTAIGNLLENARKYGGDRPEVTLAARRSNHVVEFSVSDRGIGISPEDQNQIFEKFYQARTRLSAHSGGVGLGLSIVSFIVEKHRGELVVESNPGKGSTFTIQIPLAGSPMPA